MIGIIGGMGPAATVTFYDMLTKLTPASKDQDHLQLMILSDAAMPDRTTAILEGNDSRKAEEIRTKLLEDAKKLQAAGCDKYCLTCNTAHYFMSQLKDEISIPFVSMIDEAAKAVAVKHPGGRVAILATTGTLNTRLYQDALAKYGAKGEGLSPKGDEACMHLIYGCIKAGKPADKVSLDIIAEELKSFDCGLAACTELSVIKQQGLLPDNCYDAMEILAKALIQAE